MGVNGLWQLLDPVGKRVHLQSLRGKVLAIDASIWLHQFVKGFRDRDGNPMQNAHLLGLFHRILKLLSYGIKPIFVFDGGVPALKRQTLAARRQKKLEAKDKADVSRTKMLQNFLRRRMQEDIHQSLPPTLRMARNIQKFSKRQEKTQKKRTQDQQKQLDRKLSSSEFSREGNFAEDEALAAFTENYIESISFHDEKKSPEAAIEASYPAWAITDYSDNFSSIMSPHFDSLPLETQHEILFDMQESKKNNSWGKLDLMPKDGNKFSSFQMDRLRKRNVLQKKIRKVQTEMGQRNIHVQSLDEILDADFGAELEEVDESNKEQKIISTNTTTPLPSGSESPTYSHHLSKEEAPELSELEDDEQLAIAIQMSLEQKISSPNNAKPVDLFLGDKRAAMVQVHPHIKIDSKFEEKAGRSVGIDLASEIATLPNASSFAKFCDTVRLNDKIGSPRKPIVPEEHKYKIDSCSSSESTSDMEEVSCKEFHCDPSKNSNTTDFHIEFNRTEAFVPEEDMFADIFESEDKEISKISPEMFNASSPVIFPSSSKESAEFVSKHFENVVDSDENFELTQDGPYDEDSMQNLTSGGRSLEESVNIIPVKENMLEAIETGHADDVIEAEAKDKIIEDCWMHPNQSTLSANSDKEDDSRPKKKFNSLGRPQKMISAQYMQAQENLNEEISKLQREKGFQERVATSITDQMQIESQELLALFGIPYVISPTEAESQCAFLDSACFTDGTITDDSDIWLFGGKRVYKNFFLQGEKPVELFLYSDVLRRLSLDREKLIAIAMLVGCDYTDGIEGVGVITALEIVTEFWNPDDPRGVKALSMFSEWLADMKQRKPGTVIGSKIREKFLKLKLKEGFPSEAVYTAFVDPSTDKSEEKFKWGKPNLDSLRTYTRNKFGWNQTKCDGTIQPILHRMYAQNDDASSQTTMDRFISIEGIRRSDNVSRKLIAGSKRLKNAMKKLKQSSSGTGAELNLSESDSESEVSDAASVSPRKKKPKHDEKQVKVQRKISGKSEQGVISQRLQEQTDQELKKKRAIAIYRKCKEK